MDKCYLGWRNNLTDFQCFYLSNNMNDWRINLKQHWSLSDYVVQGWAIVLARGPHRGHGS